MYWKALFFQDTATAGLIAKDPNPGRVKMLGRAIKAYDDNLWACVRVGYMTYACWLKYTQNADLRQILLDTGDRIIVEASPLDKIWGIGISEEAAAAGHPWEGENLLGKVLMDIRARLRVDAAPQSA